ncbi:MAG: restriction endonuclease subunit S [Saprospiraceae bacterium]|nr:restriction endonuclease subunit S [Candidatus Vicinibacter affinis]
MSSLETPFIETTERKITYAGLKNCSANLIPNNSIIISSRAPIGYVAVLKDKMTCNQGCKALVPKYGNVDSLYAYYMLTTKVEEMNRLGSGSTFKEISKSKLELIKIKLPDLKIQQKIASILEQADAARQKRIEANQLTDQFLQSAFLEMFGDPVRNEKGWEVKELENVCNKVADGTHFSPPNSEVGEFKYITAKNIKKYGFDFSSLTFIDEKHHKEIYRRCNPEYGDVLYIKDGVTTGIAMVNTLKEEFSLLSSVALFKLNNKINSQYLSHYLNSQSVYDSIRRSMGGAAITRLTLEKLKRIKVALPPLPLQQKYANIVERVEQLRVKQRESEKELENLFQSLMQKYFSISIDE